MGKEHPVLWFVALDCRNEPGQVEFERAEEEKKKMTIFRDGQLTGVTPLPQSRLKFNCTIISSFTGKETVTNYLN